MSCFQMIFYSIIIIIICNIGFHSASYKTYSNLVPGDTIANTATTRTINWSYANHRKLLLHGSCTNRDLSISQSRGSSSGIPKYIVEIVNTCIHGCATSNIHLHCGWFASANMVNPKTFKRLSYDDCLVNGGRPLKTSQTIRFTYSNSFMYPMALKFASFC